MVCGAKRIRSLYLPGMTGLPSKLSTTTPPAGLASLSTIDAATMRLCRVDLPATNHRTHSLFRLFVCAMLKIMLHIHTNLLRPHPLKGRGPAEWRNMGGPSRAVLVVSNPKTRPPFFRSFPTAVPASQHSAHPDLCTLCFGCRTAPAIRETSPRGRSLFARDRSESPRSSSAKEGAWRQTTFEGGIFCADGMAGSRGEGRRTVLSRETGKTHGA